MSSPTAVVRPSCYRDSVALMQLSADFVRLAGFQSSPYRYVGYGGTGGLCREATAGCIMETTPNIVILSPILLILLRICQGIALGGEYGGAAIYVAEHAPQGQRGYYTGWLQATASLGLVAALLVVITTRRALASPAS